MGSRRFRFTGLRDDVIAKRPPPRARSWGYSPPSGPRLSLRQRHLQEASCRCGRARFLAGFRLGWYENEVCQRHSQACRSRCRVGLGFSSGAAHASLQETVPPRAGSGCAPAVGPRTAPRAHRRRHADHGIGAPLPARTGRACPGVLLLPDEPLPRRGDRARHPSLPDPHRWPHAGSRRGRLPVVERRGRDEGRRRLHPGPPRCTRLRQSGQPADSLSSAPGHPTRSGGGGPMFSRAPRGSSTTGGCLAAP